ncbi:hypothetical protein [Xenorhabdus sp. PB30.3]|uniref:hypothetical protein n=1 Tax=Xenorhabdus sp. PB30.3 TaxID=2788941 RepID=UPI001E4D4997|nr:hypothetical protein [Xenorhabdus sp. PB30.3]MCC8379141.1 hypothetical protein [Xenorhabdus sp. PB30.3]
MTFSENCLGKYLFFHGYAWKYNNRDNSYCQGMLIPPVPEIWITLPEAFLCKIHSDGKTLSVPVGIGTPSGNRPLDVYIIDL